MNVVGRVSSFITQGMYSVATPFHPFGGAVDIIVVKQEDGTFRSTPWYVRFGKFQGVLKGAEKFVRIEVNGVEADFHMLLDNSGEAYFVREVDPNKDDNEGLKSSDNLEGRWVGQSTNYSNIDNDSQENDFYGGKGNNEEGEVRDERVTLGMDQLERVESDSGRIFYEFQDDQSSMEGSIEFSEYGSSRYENLDSLEHALESQNSSSEVVLVSVDGHILTAPISSSERNAENVQLSTPQFHLGPGEGTNEYERDEAMWTTEYLNDLDVPPNKTTIENLVDTNIFSEHQLEPREGSGEQSHQSLETDSLIQSIEVSLDDRCEDTSGSPKKDEVFKSCLELPALAMQSTNGVEENMDSSMENPEATDDSRGQSPRSPLMTGEAEQEKSEASRSEDGSSSSILRNHHSVFLLESCDKVAIREGNSIDMDNNGSDSGPLQFSSSDQESQKQMDVEEDIRIMESCQEASGFEDKFNNIQNIDTVVSSEGMNPDILTRVGFSLCGDLLHAGMGSSAAQDAFDANRVYAEELKLSASSIIKNEKLIVRIQGKYFPWEKVAHIILGMVAFSLDLPVDVEDAIPVGHETPEAKEDASGLTPTSSRLWRLWPIPFRRVKTLEAGSSSSNDEFFVDSEPVTENEPAFMTPKVNVYTESPRKQIIRTNVPMTDQISSLNLKEGQNMVNFVFSTRVLGSQKVEAHIYLWKWNTKIVISDVDGTITKSDVLGQFMPLVGKDWTHSGIARLFSAIKENGYQLLFLSARAIVQAYLTKNFLFNLKQDGKSLPNGPVVISPDGLFPSLYREVIRRAPHEFKIACLEDIKALFPPDYNPFYAGFGNRDTDELSYRKIGIPKGKIFIINPKGEVAINHRIDVKSYTSLHTLVHDMFPPTSLVEQEDYNSWNYWKMPLPDID